MSFRTGARIAVDAGGTRVGVARCDPGGILVFPVATLTRRADGAEIDRISRMVDEFAAFEIIVGLPISLSGHEGPAALSVRRYAEAIAEQVHVPVRLVDERLTTVSAHQQLREAGRSTERHRSVVDQVAATVILEQALEQERRTGSPPGELVAKET